MIRNLVASHHPVLRQVAEPATDPRLVHEVVSDLYETLLDLAANGRPGAALAAPQIGRSVRVIYVNCQGMNAALINPVIESRTERTVVDFEGCLSLPGVNVAVERAYGISLSYQHDLSGPRRTNRYTDFLARVLQHEVDHLNGVLITDLAAVPR